MRYEREREICIGNGNVFDSRFDGINILCVWLSMKLSKLLLQKFWKFVDGTSSEDDTCTGFVLLVCLLRSRSTDAVWAVGKIWNRLRYIYISFEMNNIHFLFQISTFSNPENFCKVLLLLRQKKEVICEEIFPKLTRFHY